MARMRHAGLSLKPITDRSCCAAHKEAQRSNHAKSSPARSIQEAGRGIRHVRQMREALAGMIEVRICRTRYSMSRHLSERPVPCLASGKRWVHGNGSLVEQPLVDTGLRTAGMPRVAPLCFESLGIMRAGLTPWRKNKNIFSRVGGGDGLKTTADAGSLASSTTPHRGHPRACPEGLTTSRFWKRDEILGSSPRMRPRA